MENMVSKSQFKPHVLQYFREIEKTGKELVISDRGKPVLKIVPYVDNPEEALKVLRDTVIKYEDPTGPVGSVNLPPPLHPDPADRIIIATALSNGAPLVTKDKKIAAYSHVKTIW